jgi:WD40 repeat protein/serine/threonine protein kinase/class 3 adenylate cyclase
MIPDSATARPEQVAAFFQKHRTGLITLVFTDLVDSTVLLRQLGDQGGATFMQRRRQLIRDALRTFAGSEEIETAGDSFLLAFPKPSDAVRFALQSQTRLRQFSAESGLPVQERMGIHLGEVVIAENETEAKAKDLYGISLATCARVMSLAQGGQVLLTRGVFDSARQVLKGEDLPGVGTLAWVSHGPYVLKGIEEPVEVCEVGEAGQSPLAAPKTSEKAQRQIRPGDEPVLGWRPAIGQNVPNTPWNLEQKLGEGGFGEVWVARHRKLKERRVFKFCFRADRVRALKREMTLFRLLKEQVGEHRNLVRLHEVYLEEPPFYLEEEYVEGKDLRTWCEAQAGASTLSQETRFEIVAQAAEALQAAHDAGIIHRDVKPGNILISGDPSGMKPLTVKLTDFGIGQVVSAEALIGVTQAGFTQTMLGSESSSHTGTQLYMAPELLAGKPASIRSDIYSLGVVLYQLLVGDFSRPVTMDWDRTISDPLLRQDLVLCLAGDPEERFAGPVQLARHLRQLPERRAALARDHAEKAERERLRGQAARRRRLLVMAGAVATALLAVAAGLGYGLHQAQVERDRQRSHAYASDMNLAQQALAVNNLGRAQELLNRHRPKHGQHDLRGWEWRYLWQQCRSDAQALLCQRPSAIWSLAVSRDGKWLAVGEHINGGASIWDLRTRQPITSWSAGQGDVRVAFSPKEDLLAFSFATTNGPDHVRLWDAVNRKVSGEEIPLAGQCMGLAFSEDGQTLITSAWGVQDEVAVWQVQTGTKAVSCLLPRLDQTRFTAGTPFAAAPDGKLAAFAPAGTIHCFDLALGKERWKAKGADETVKALALSPDGRLLASGAGFVESTIRLWDVASGREIRRLEGHRAWVPQIVFWPDGKTLASANGDQTIRLWDVSDLANVPPPHVLRGHQLEVWRLALLPNHRTLVSGCKDGSVLLWDTARIPHESTRAILPITVEAWRFTPDSKSVLTVDRQGYVARWTGTDFQEKESLLDIGTNFFFASYHSSVLFSSDGRRVAIGSTNGALRIWDVDHRALLHQAAIASGSALPWAFTEGDKRLVVGYLNDNSIHEWDLASWHETRSWGRAAGMSFFAFSPEEGWALRLNSAGVSLLWNKATGRETRQQLDFRNINDVTFSPDGRLFAAASDIGYAKLWQTATRREVAMFRGFLMGIHSVAFSPDSQRLALGSNGNEAIKLWDVESHLELLTLEGRGSLFMASTAFSPDGNLLGSRNAQGALHLWRAPSWAELELAAKAEGNSALAGQPQ